MAKLNSTMVAIIAWAATAGACGSPARTATTTTPSGQTTGKRGIEAAGLPYVILDARTGREVPTEQFWQTVASSRAVCVGEEHKNPHHHWAQLTVIEQLLAQPAWTEPGLGMEMFQRPFQGVLDDFAAGKIDEASLLSRADYANRWGYDFDFYRPQISRLVSKKGSLLALNAARELTKKVVRQGLESLTADEKQQLPDLNLTDEKHRAWFDAIMAEMSGEGGSPHGKPAPAPAPAPATSAPPPAAAPAMTAAMPSMDRVYTVQVIWDETMADGAAKWLSATEKRHLVVMAGVGHCHHSAIVGRLKRRGIASVVSIKPIVDAGKGNVAAELAKPDTDFLLVMTIPRQ